MLRIMELELGIVKADNNKIDIIFATMAKEEP
jgi:hypothetical protein